MSKLLTKIVIGLKKGMTVEEVRKQIGGNKKTIGKCKLEIDLKNRIRELIEQGRSSEAQEFARQLLETRIVDNDTIFAILELAVSRKDTKLGEEIFALFPTRIMNYEEQKIILYGILKLNSHNIEAINKLRKIEEKQGDIEQAKILHRRKKQLEENLLNRGKKKEKTFETIMLEKFERSEEEKSPIERAREIIYASDDIEKMAEEINSLLEGQDKTTRVLLIAELFSRFGLTKKAESSLRSYKKSLELEDRMEEIKRVNQAIEIVRNNKRNKFKWTSLWQYKDERERE